MNNLRNNNNNNNNNKRSMNDFYASISPQYLTRRSSSRITTNDLPLEHGAIGFCSPWAALWFCLFLVVPFAYVYILLMLLRDLCLYFPETIHEPLQQHFPFLANIAVQMMRNSSLWMEIWCVIEALFFVGLKIQIAWLQSKDPLEASLSAAPMMDPKDRQQLWARMMDLEKHDPCSFLCGWFFDADIDTISRYDINDFICWSMFDGRNQEHLTQTEVTELEDFVDELEYHISIQKYGTATVTLSSTENNPEQQKEQKQKLPLSLVEQDENSDPFNTTSDSNNDYPSLRRRNVQKPNLDNENGSNDDDGDYDRFTTKLEQYPKPKKLFRFSVESNQEQSNFFSNLYISYKQRYEKYRSTMTMNAMPNPVQEMKKLMSETAHQLVEAERMAEESAMATAASMFDGAKQLSEQIMDAWNNHSSFDLKSNIQQQRIETAKFISAQQKAVQEQLRGYRVMLTRMREMSSAVPSKQMAALMRRITECNNALENTERRAREAFVQATGFAKKNLQFRQLKEPRRYAKYSSDPLLGIVTYPLGFHLTVLGLTEIPLRLWMRHNGFERRCVGPVVYYFHPGLNSTKDDTDGNYDDNTSSDDQYYHHHHGSASPSRKSKDSNSQLPIVFVHGIGIGVLIYAPLIYALLKTGRPILIPEIPYISGFRPWQSPNSVLSPAVVSSTMTAMLAIHGFSKGTFVGHSFGTSWLSYMCKYAPNAVAALLFLDPICFALHYSRLTKSFVYSRADPGTTSYMVRTDVIVNWTVQRSFPWNWIILFVDQIHVPCTVFVGDKDPLVPSEKVEQYFRSKDIPVCDFESAQQNFFSQNDINLCVLRGHYHGQWTESPGGVVPKMAQVCDILCCKVERE